MAQSTIRRPMQIIGLATSALLLAACAQGTGAGATPTSAGQAGPSVGIGQTSIGAVLTGSGGKTLYQFAKDTSTTSAWTGGAASTWPPLTVGTGQQVQPASGLGKSFATIKRDDGSTQVTYDGHPLYYYAPDSAAGDVKGQGVGGKWFAESPSGGPVQAGSSSSSAAASPSASSSGYSNGGY